MGNRAITNFFKSLWHYGVISFFGALAILIFTFSPFESTKSIFIFILSLYFLLNIDKKCKAFAFLSLFIVLLLLIKFFANIVCMSQEGIIKRCFSSFLHLLLLQLSIISCQLSI